jgi:MFS family permease
MLPLRDRRFAWYYTGRFVSTMGSTVAPIALTFAVLDFTHNSATALGQVLAARSIPLVIFLLVGGVVADRFSRSVVMQVSHLLSAATQGTVAVLLLTGTAQLWMIIVLEALNGTVSAFTFPAMQGVVPQIVPRDYLQQANALLSFSRSGLAMLGPSVGAILVVGFGSGWAIAIDALSWALASVCMARVRVPAAVRQGASSMWHELVEGWSTFVSFTWVWVVVLAFGALNMITAGAWGTLGPTLAKQTIGIRAWGFAASSEAIGLLLMTLVLMQHRIRRPLFAGMIGIGALVLPLLVLGIHPETVTLVVATFIGGAGTEVFSIGWSTALQEHIPNRLLSRVSSYDALGSFVAIPLGELLFGPLAGVFSIRRILVVSGVSYAVIVALTLVSSSVRNLEHVDDATAQTPHEEERATDPATGLPAGGDPA